MGLSVTTSHVIWFFAFLGLAGGAYAAFMDLSETFDHAQAARRGIDKELITTQLSNAIFCYNGNLDVIQVNATVVGNAEVDATNITFIVNGTPTDGFTPATDGATEGSTVWLPGEWMNFTKTGVTTDPDALVLVTQHGVAVRATKLTCPFLDSILLTPSAGTIPVGSTQDFSAQGYDQFGRPFAVPSFSWTTNAGSISTLNTTSARLIASTTSATGRVVTATYQNLSSSATIDLSPLAPTSIVVSPNGVNVSAGTTRTFSSTATDTYGNVNATAPVTWSTDAGSISSSGVLTAQTTSQAARTVTATTGSIHGDATIDIVAAAPASVTVSPSSATVQVGSTATFTATVLDSYGNTNGTATLTWTTDAGSITSGGVLTAQTTSATGKTVTATASGISGTSAITVSPGAPATVSVSPSSVNVAAGGTQTFTATLVDSYGNTNSTATPTWTTTAGTITSGGVLTAQTTAQNGLGVTATSNGHTGSATVNVVAGAVDHLTLSPTSATVQTTHSQSFTATAYDVYNNVVTTTITYSATNGTITSAGLYTAPSTTGSDTINASASGKSTTATVTITRVLHVAQLLTYNSANQLSNVFNRSEVVQTRITIVDQDGNAVSGASVSYQLTPPASGTGTTATASTNAGGIAFFNYTIPNPAANKGTWTDAVTNVTSAAANTTYSSAANVVTSRTFTVVN